MAIATNTVPRFLLRLYIAGNSPNSVRAIANANALCEGHLRFKYRLEIVDLLKDPKRALADGVVVTPTLVRVKPLPVQRVIGNLSDEAEVLLALVKG